MSDVPPQIGRYRVERLLGQGAMGSVYLARDPDLHRAVAVKTIRNLELDAERMATFLERFRNEARAAARLSHPSIVAVYDVGESDDVGPYMVFEYVAGSTLKHILRSRGALSPESVVRLGRQLAAAIDTAHAAGVIHRDVKPDNILVAASGDAKLADFGVARVPDAALTREGQFLGTPCYAAPETIDRGAYGPHSDLFSLAAVLYEVVSGVRAFPGEDAVSVAHKVAHDDPEPPSVVAPSARVPKDVDRVIMRGLAEDENERYATATELVEALRAAYVAAGALEDDGFSIPPATRSRGWVFPVVVLVALVVGVGVVLAFQDNGLGIAIVTSNADAGVSADAGSDGGEDAAVDAASMIVVPDAGSLALDAGASQPDSGIASMDAFEREEAAKDAITRARARLAAGDTEGAARALEQARAYDPGNDAIPALEAQIHGAHGS